MIYDSRPMNNTIREFTDLHTWQENHKLALQIYKITQQFPKGETFALVDQMRRAVISITSNIAEGFGRQTIKEKIQFYYQAQGSLTEVKNQLIFSKDIGYMNQEMYVQVINQANIGHQLLQGLIKKTKSFIHKS